ncbi:antibiotic biosynthesis monooxygenase [Ktedonosporobacter rubrisoli]|uniref:Antibiotic biosynthesis monooxygenase n=1 Tax=Ktedonosporobacter rubrisoli TaxID=2509675 RepID=A0A4P6JKB5_KTERU|nr:antibiotic biosynthesis monooxygenase family protein [Ktedonosporobacter rubrisoli]QBD75410.1 antibiotic biosynthesis monooxygenase [Ktedonosporobacter rubrisoli]
MKQYYAQHVKATVKPGKRDELIQQLQQLSAELLTRASGCIYYLISTTEEPDVLWISELWTSKEAKDAIAMKPESAKGMKELMPLITSMTDRTHLTVVGGTGVD